MVKYTVDKKKREELIKTSYKYTEEWHEKKKFRTILIILTILVPLLVSGGWASFHYFSNSLTNKNIFLMVIITIFVLVIMCIILNLVISHQKKECNVVPMEREKDILVMDKNTLIYTYKGVGDGMIYETVISFKDIIDIKYSEIRHMLFITGGYKRRIFTNKKIIKEFNIEKEMKREVRIPLYFENSDKLIEYIWRYSGVSTEKQKLT